MNRVLEIKDVPLYVSLGCSPSEQAQPQKVLISCAFSFVEALKAERTDSIEDAICYVKVAETLERICQAKSYHLIEHLCSEIFNELKQQYPSCKLDLKVHKVQPPHRLLQGGTSYQLKEN